MNAEMKNYVIKLLETYHDRERMIAVLRYDLEHPAKVNSSEQIEAMNYRRGDDIGNDKGHISNKTLYIALNYEEQAGRLNAEAAREVADELFGLEQQQKKLLYYVSLLEKRQANVIHLIYQKKQLNGARMDGRNGGLSPKTIRNHHMILKDFFTYAQSKYKLPCNPTLSTTRPEVVAKEMRVLSPSEMHIFMEEIMKETQRIAILTDLFVGFRVGELLALEIADLDLERQTLRINKNLIRVKTEALSLDNPNIRILNYDPKKKTHLIVQSTPKTKTSNREIAISDGLCELLIRHLYTLAHSSWPNPDNLLFPSRAGTHIDPKSFEIRLNAISKRCEIKKVNPHALRHTLATRLVEERTPLNIVQGILGHSSIETTRKYLHKSEDIEREAITSMTDYLNGEQFNNAPRLNGAKKRAKFAGIPLPDFSQRERITANNA